MTVLLCLAPSHTWEVTKKWALTSIPLVEPEDFRDLLANVIDVLESLLRWD